MPLQAHCFDGVIVFELYMFASKTFQIQCYGSHNILNVFAIFFSCICQPQSENSLLHGGGKIRPFMSLNATLLLSSLQK